MRTRAYGVGPRPGFSPGSLVQRCGLLRRPPLFRAARAPDRRATAACTCDHRRYNAHRNVCASSLSIVYSPCVPQAVSVSVCQGDVSLDTGKGRFFSASDWCVKRNVPLTHCIIPRSRGRRVGCARRRNGVRGARRTARGLSTAGSGGPPCAPRRGRPRARGGRFA